MTTKPQPADLLAPLLALAKRVRKLPPVWGDMDADIERNSIADELESLAAHRGDALKSAEQEAASDNPPQAQASAGEVAE